MRLKLWLLAAATLLAVLGTGCGNSPNGPASVAFSGSAVIPHEGFRDWISYSDQVSVVTVVSEGELPVDSAVLERGEGSIGRRVTIRIDETIWSVAERPALEGEHEMTTLRVGSREGTEGAVHRPAASRREISAAARNHRRPACEREWGISDSSGARTVGAGRLDEGPRGPGPGIRRGDVEDATTRPPRCCACAPRGGCAGAGCEGSVQEVGGPGGAC